MEHKLKASIIIPTYNRSELLRLTMDSLMNQTVNTNQIEVIICDDGSSDNTKQVVKEYDKKMNIKYIFQEDKGYRAGAARNKGIKSSEAPICIFIDTGILLTSNAIEEHIRIHKNNEKNCSVIGYVYGFDENNKYKDEILNCLESSNIDETVAKLKQLDVVDSRETMYKELGDDLNSWPAPWVIFWSCNISVKREVLLKVGMFDEYYNTWGGEDTDLGLALEKEKVKFVLGREAAGVHYPHDREEIWCTNPDIALQDYERKRDYMHKKYDTEATKLWYEIGEMELNKAMLNRRNTHLGQRQFMRDNSNN